jgi:serine protease 16
MVILDIHFTPPPHYMLFTGHPAALAPAWGALVISLEHRFYGLSVPAGGLGMAQLQYLSSRHA